MTTTTTFGELLDAYAADPTPDSLATLRDAIRGAPGFDPDLRVGQEADRLLAAEAWEEAVAVLEGAMPGALLSPSVHARLSTALRRLGRTRDADRHARLTRLAVDSVLATGDGSAGRPWSVLRISDEHDVLSGLGSRPTGQQLLHDEGRLVDRIECEDGRVAHFDVTDVPQAGARGRG